MNGRATYRGEVLPGLGNLSADEISRRIEHAGAIDGLICDAIRAYRCRHATDPDAVAAANALQSWADLGFASVTAAEHRQQVSIFTRRARV